MFHNILLAYDRSEYSQKAVQIAGDLARLQPNPSLRVITSVDPVPGERT
jgi:nucleotide-binding universal stress UspA family protein